MNKKLYKMKYCTYIAFNIAIRTLYAYIDWDGQLNFLKKNGTYIVLIYY